MNHRSELRPESLWMLVSRAVEAIQDLVVRHFHLAMVELETDTRGLGKELVLAIGGVPLVLVGYLILCLAAAAALAPMLGAAGGLAVLGVVNVLGGAICVLLGVKALRKRRFLDDTRAQVKVSASRLVASFAHPAIDEVSNVR